MKIIASLLSGIVLCCICLPVAASQAASPQAEIHALELVLDGSTAIPSTRAVTDFSEIEDSTWTVEYTSSSAVIQELRFTDEVIAIGTYPRLTFYNENDRAGGCYLGSQLGVGHEYIAAISYPDSSAVATEYFEFDVDGDALSGVYYYLDEDGEQSADFPLTGTRSGSDGNSHLYYVPFIPGDGDFGIGFGVSNIESSDDVDLTFEYYSNAGEKLGEQTALVPGDGQISFMKDVDVAENGWARITASGPVRGMALVFGSDDAPMYDEDMQSLLSSSLTAPHMDSSGQWTSSAMLCNPNAGEAEVVMTFHPAGGGETMSREISIPAMGSVQYVLSDFPSSGAVWFEADPKIAGFLLYDGRTQDNKWLGGLSIQSAD